MIGNPYIHGTDETFKRQCGLVSQKFNENDEAVEWFGRGFLSDKEMGMDDPAIRLVVNADPRVERREVHPRDNGGTAKLRRPSFNRGHISFLVNGVRMAHGESLQPDLYRLNGRVQRITDNAGRLVPIVHAHCMVCAADQWEDAQTAAYRKAAYPPTFGKKQGNDWYVPGLIQDDGITTLIRCETFPPTMLFDLDRDYICYVELVHIDDRRMNGIRHADPVGFYQFTFQVLPDPVAGVSAFSDKNDKPIVHVPKGTWEDPIIKLPDDGSKQLAS